MHLNNKFIIYSILVLTSLFVTSWPIDADPNRQKIWRHYKAAKEARHKQELSLGIQQINRAMKLLGRIKNKREYSMVFWEDIILKYLIQKKPAAEKKHRSLYIVIKKAKLKTLLDKMGKKIKTLKGHPLMEVTDEQLTRLRQEAKEFDLIMTALTGGSIQYTHQIVVAESTQTDIIFRNLYKNWFGRDIYLYSTNIDTLEPSISRIIQRYHAEVDTFSIVLPATLSGKKRLGIGLRKKDSHLMEGGLKPTSLPLIPYVYYADKRGLMINNIDTLSARQLLHEYFHMIEGVLPTGFDAHAWLPNKKSPPGITTEIEYYRYVFNNSIKNRLSELLFRSIYGSGRANNKRLRNKAKKFAGRYSQSKLRQAFNHSQMHDEKHVRTALKFVPDYPFAAVKAGGFLRRKGNSLQAYRLFKMHPELDADNLMRDIQMGWLCDDNVSLARYALPYFQSGLKKMDRINSAYKSYALIGLARAYYDNQQPKQALKILLNEKNAVYLSQNKKIELDANLLKGRIYFKLKKKALAKKYFQKTKVRKRAIKYLNLMNKGRNPGVKAFESALSKIKNARDQSSYESLIKAGKKAKSSHLKIKYFYQASLRKPERWIPWFWIGHTAYQNKQYTTAKYSFSKMKSLSSHIVVRNHYNFYTGMIFHALEEYETAGKLLLEWVKNQERAKLKVSNWYYSFLMDYFDTIMNNKSKARIYADKIIGQSDNKTDWFYQRASIWLGENRF